MIKKKPLSPARIKRIKEEIKKLDAEQKTEGKKFIAEQKTLLTRFVMEKYINYMEPQRTRPHKGVPVKFSKKKYLATLYMHTNRKYADIAKELKISHGLLRKWRTEKRFNDLVVKHWGELAETFIRYVFSRIAANHIFHEDYKKRLLSELPKIDFEQVQLKAMKKYDADYEQLSDLYNYDDNTILHIIEFLFDYIKEELPQIADQNLIFAFRNEVTGIYSLLMYSKKNITKFEDLVKKVEENNLRIRNSAIDSLISCLSQTRISSDDKKEAILLLNYLKQPVDIVKTSKSKKKKIK